MGDMILERWQLGRGGHDAPSGATYANFRPWTNGTIPYELPAGVTPTQRATFQAACAVWSEMANVRCVPRSNEVDFVGVTNENAGCFSYVGMIGGRAQLNLQDGNPGCWNRLTILHELGHAFGMLHEHQRSDRNTYVTINYGNVQANMAGAFEIVATSMNYGPYDHRSVMHYFRTAFSISGSLDTIVPLAPYQNLASQMGFGVPRADGIIPTPGDGATMAAVYGAPVVTPVSGNDAYSVVTGTSLTVGAPGVLGNDVSAAGAMTAAVVTSPSNGSVQLAGNGAFTYTPTAGFVGTDAFSYRATNAAGAGNVATVTLVVAEAPGPPSGFRVESVIGNTVTLRWTAPSSGLAPTGYVVEGGVVPGQVLGSFPTGPTPSFTFAAPTGSFFLRVHALAGAFRSAPSNEIVLHVGVPVPPSAPATLLGLVNGSALSLAWRNSLQGGAPTALLLDVSGSLSASLPLGLTDTFSFAGVPSGTYTLSVRATNAAGTSPPSNAVTLTFPSACSGVPQAPDAVQVTKSGNQLAVSWNPPASGPAPTSYLLRVTGALALDLPMATRAVAGPVPNGTYTLRVLALNPCGTGPATSGQTVTVP